MVKTKEIIKQLAGQLAVSRDPRFESDPKAVNTSVIKKCFILNCFAVRETRVPAAPFIYIDRFWPSF